MRGGVTEGVKIITLRTALHTMIMSLKTVSINRILMDY